MKKSCDGCKALDELSNYLVLSCKLGHKITEKGIPMEDCPKPKTIKEFVRLCQEIQ